MKGIFDNRIFNVVDVAGDMILDGTGEKEFIVDLGDERLIVDPTDEQVANASNLAEWYGVDAETAVRLRLMLRGESSIEEWYIWKEEHHSA